MSWLLHRTELTPEQLRIVEMSPESHRLILGPPGSGKPRCSSTGLHFWQKLQFKA